MKQIPLPLDWHPTFEFLDSSKMEQLARCPRKLFFRYILGITMDVTSVHLVFGESLHQALEYLYNNGLSEDNLPEAYAIFLRYYRQHFNEMQDDMHAPKSPEFAYKVLYGYIQMYGELDTKNFEVIGTELHEEFFIDPNNPERTMRGKMDLVVRDKRTGKYLVLDHKTSKANSRPWRESWLMSIQMNNYLLATVSRFGGDEVEALVVNGLFITKTDTGKWKGDKVKFLRIPIPNNDIRILGHLTTVNYLYNTYEHFMNELSQCSPDDAVLSTFPKSPVACGDYGGCAYYGICSVTENPLTLVDKTLTGFRKEYWDPKADKKTGVGQ